MSTTLQAPLSLGLPTTGTHSLTPMALIGAIRVAYGIPGDPPVLLVRPRKERNGWRIRVQLVGTVWTPEERRTWVIEEFLPRWTQLEYQLGVRLFLRREWV